MENQTLSSNQSKFVRDAKNQGYEIDYDYSGRGMYGRSCPSVRLGRYETMKTKANVREDSMGMGKVVYAQN